MPNFGSVTLALRPQSLIKRLHKPSWMHEHEENQNHHHHDHGTGPGIWCLPHKKNSKQLEGKDAVKKLTGDVEELMVTSEISLNPVFSWGVTSSNPSSEYPVGKCLSEAEQKQHVHEVSEDVHKQLSTILGLIRLFSEDHTEQRAGPKGARLADAAELLEQLIAADLPAQLLAQLGVLEFEARKDVMNVCCALLWPGMPQQIDKQVLQYMQHHPTFFKLLVDGYANEETALHYGVVLRSCARHSALVEAFLSSGLVPVLMEYTKHKSIDISSDAFYTLREMLLEHKDISARWLEKNYADFFKVYNGLLSSGEYIAERQAQRLLTDMLLDRHFQKVMVSYVSNEQHLQIHMLLLKNRSKAIQLEAFQVFKIFVANPSKPQRVHQILYRNRDKLVAHLGSLPSAKPDDQKLGDEVKNIVDKLLRLDAPTSPKGCRAASSAATKARAALPPAPATVAAL